MTFCYGVGSNASTNVYRLGEQSDDLPQEFLPLVSFEFNFFFTGFVSFFDFDILTNGFSLHLYVISVLCGEPDVILQSIHSASASFTSIQTRFCYKVIYLLIVESKGLMHYRCWIAKKEKKRLIAL